MTRTKNYLVVVLLASVILAISGCSVVLHRDRASGREGGDRYGAPPDSPEHGYRYKQSDGIELIFDSGIGVYVVSGNSYEYYHQGIYYRWNNNSWEESPQINEGWAPAPEERVPPGLRKAHSHGNRGNSQH